MIERKLKRAHKGLNILEAGFIWCLRRDIEYNDDDFIDNYFMTENFNSSEGSEFDNICKDLRSYRYRENYIPITVTDIEYELCIDEFGMS